MERTPTNQPEKQVYFIYFTLNDEVSEAMQVSTLSRLNKWKSIQEISALYPDTKRGEMRRMFVAKIREGSNLKKAVANLNCILTKIF